MKPRILFGGLFHETHTFLGERTRWEDFEVTVDAAILAKVGDGSPTDGFLAEAARHGWEVIPTIDARCVPSGTVEDAMFERYWREFERRAAPALAAGVDGIYLVLHGAMATETFRDTEGELLGRIRALPGAKDVPIFGVLDLHANVSARMCREANGLVMYRENPHTDARQAAERGAALLARCLREKRVPRMIWCRPPIMWAPPGTGTAVDPDDVAEILRPQAGDQVSGHLGLQHRRRLLLRRHARHGLLPQRGHHAGRRGGEDPPAGGGQPGLVAPRTRQHRLSAGGRRGAGASAG